MYDLELENDARVESATRKVIHKMREDILDSLKEFRSIDELTESGEAAVNLMGIHLNLLDKAAGVS